MSARMLTFPTREEWLKARKDTIGGSDASATVGKNPYKSNVDLWLEKTGQVIPEDISDKPYVKFGTEAEYHLRELFRLDHPQYEVCYVENNLFLNDKYPWGHYSADGWLLDDKGRTGILEIKTTEILQSMQKEKWKNRVPDNYYIQLLHGFLIIEADFAVLKGRLKSVFNGEVYVQIKHFTVEREELEEDIEYLKNAEKEFYENIRRGTRPALILPDVI